jgi:Right handed beta helix region
MGNPVDTSVEARSVFGPGRRSERIRRAAFQIVVLAAPVVSRAAGQCVSPAADGCHTTIQAAVDAAAPGDTIQIDPGVYFENVQVPAGRDGLRIVGSGPRSTIVDPDAPNAGPAFRIGSSEVEVTALAIRNGSDSGVVVAAGTSGVFLHGLRFLGGRGAGAIRVEASSTQARIVGNDIRAAGNVGVALEGGNDGSVVRGNAISQMDTAVDVLSDDVEIAANRIEIFRTAGIRVEGARAKVASNVVEIGSVSGEGLAVTGDSFDVRGNRLTNAGPLVASCTPCTTAVVASNVVVGSFRFDRTPGLGVAADAPGLVVTRNRVSRATAGPAFLVDGTGVRLTRNLAVDTGQPVDGDCYLARGQGAHRLDHNVATRCGASGFRVEADDVVLEDNLSQGAGLSGFFVDGAGGTRSGVVLTRNRASESSAAGFSVTGDAVATVLSGNRGSANRYDFCDDGSATDVSGGNAFGTISTVCDVLR